MTVCASCGGVNPRPWGTSRYLVIWYPDGHWEAWFNRTEQGWYRSQISYGSWSGLSGTYHGRSLPPPSPIVDGR